MWSRWVTIGILLSSLLGLITWDIYVAVNAVPGDTISEITLATARRIVFLPLSVGVVSGHLLWPIRKPLAGWWTVAILGVVGAAAIVVDVVGHPHIMPAIPFATGVLIGHFGWGQREE
jgi:hypothetical protein